MAYSIKQLLFLDLETSGLAPEQDCILQVGAIAVDGNLQNDDDDPGCSWDVGTTPLELSRMDSYVRAMHTKTGLYQRLAAGEGYCLYDVEDMLVRYAIAHFGAAAAMSRKVILAGNSIQFDRSFIRRHMPRFEATLHHRMVDVSTFLTCAQLWGRPVATATDAMTHEAHADALASRDALRHYREKFGR